LRISTPGALKFIRPVQEFELCANPQGARREREMIVAFKDCDFILPHLF